MKYIDSEKLIAEIERRKKQDITFRERNILVDIEVYIASLRADMIITSLQQERSLVDIDAVREDFIAEVYRVLDADHTNDRANAIIDAFDSLPTVYQEQPEVDLEKEVHNYLKIHHLHIKDGGRIVFNNDDSPNFMCDIRDIARYFYELDRARKEESVSIAESPSKTFPRVNEFDCGSSYRH